MITDFTTRPGLIDGLVIVTMKQVTDERGTVREMFRRSALRAAGIDFPGIEQINVTESAKYAVRGMHAESMTKLVTIAHGRAHGVYVDARRESPTFGAVDEVSLVPGTQVLVPSGVANGFQSLTKTQYAYCFDTEWVPGMPGLAFSPLDPRVVDRWPLQFDPTNRRHLSVKDAQAPAFDEVVRA